MMMLRHISLATVLMAYAVPVIAQVPGASSDGEFVLQGVRMAVVLDESTRSASPGLESDVARALLPKLGAAFGRTSCFSSWSEFLPKLQEQWDYIVALQVQKVTRTTGAIKPIAQTAGGKSQNAQQEVTFRVQLQLRFIGDFPPLRKDPAKDLTRSSPKDVRLLVPLTYRSIIRFTPGARRIGDYDVSVTVNDKWGKPLAPKAAAKAGVMWATPTEAEYAAALQQAVSDEKLVLCPYLFATESNRKTDSSAATVLVNRSGLAFLDLELASGIKLSRPLGPRQKVPFPEPNGQAPPIRRAWVGKPPFPLTMPAATSAPAVSRSPSAPAGSATKHKPVAPVKLFPIVKNGLWGYVDVSGKIAIKPGYQAVRWFSDGLAAANVGGRWSKDSDGNWHVQGGAWGYIDGKGRWAIQPQFWTAGDFCQGLAEVSMPAQVKRHGNRVEVKTSLGILGAFSGADAAVIDTSGKRLPFGTTVPQCPCDADPSPDALHLVRRRSVTPPQGGHGRGALSHADTNDGAVHELYGYVDNTGRNVIQPRFIAARGFSDGLAAVMEGEKWGYIDRSGSFVIPPQYVKVGDFVDGVAPVMIGGKWGYIDKTGSVCIAATFDDARSLVFGLGWVKVNDRIGYVDRTGKYVWEPSQ